MLTTEVCAVQRWDGHCWLLAWRGRLGWMPWLEAAEQVLGQEEEEEEVTIETCRVALGSR